MKYSNLTIAGVPKSFDLWDTADSLLPWQEGMKPDELLYDMYPAGCNEDIGEDACVLFKYNESASGVYILHSPHLQTISLELSPWGVEADVLLYVTFVNLILSKHKRARLYDKYAPLKGLSDEDAQKMIAERKRYLKRLLTTKEDFTMEGINACFTLKVAHLRPAISPEIQVLELQQQFVRMQWGLEED